MERSYQWIRSLVSVMRMAGNVAYFLLDRNIAAVAGHSKASTPDPKGILAPEDHHRVEENFLIRPRSDRPSFHQREGTRINLGVEPGHNTPLPEKMKEKGMIAYCPTDEDVAKN